MKKKTISTAMMDWTVKTKQNWIFFKHDDKLYETELY